LSPAWVGVAFTRTPEKNRLCLRHMKEVVNPFLKSLRGAVGLVTYSNAGRKRPTSRLPLGVSIPQPKGGL
jgi:hypothetical protein